MRDTEIPIEPDYSERYKNLPELNETVIIPSISSGLNERQQFNQIAITKLKQVAENPGWLKDESYPYIRSWLANIKRSDIKNIELYLTSLPQNIGEAIFIRVLELLHKDYPDLALWRGQSYDPTRFHGSATLNMANALDNAVYYSGSSLHQGKPRALPCLVKLPIPTLVEAYKTGRCKIYPEHGYIGDEIVKGVTGSMDFYVVGLRDTEFQCYRLPYYPDTQKMSMEVYRLSSIAESKRIEFRP